jgi:hypothetical protein
MTTAAEDGGDRRDIRQYRPWYAWVLRHTRWVQPALMWVGHFSLWLFIPYVVLSLTTDLAGRPTWLGWVALPALVLFWGSVLIDNSYHAAKLCERCMGGTPLDPEASVDKWRPALRLDHRNGLMLLILLANLIWTFGVGNLLVDGAHWAGLPRHHDTWAYLLQDLPSLVIISSYWIIQRVHRDLYPWCPWCHWGDGGDEETVPDPDPEGNGVKPAPA